MKGYAIEIFNETMDLVFDENISHLLLVHMLLITLFSILMEHIQYMYISGIDMVQLINR